MKNRRPDRRPPRRTPQAELERMLFLFEEKHSGFTVLHFPQQPVKCHNSMLGYTATKLTMHSAGIVWNATKCSAPGR